MNPSSRLGLALFGSIVILGVGIQFYYFATTVVCSLPSFGYGVCVVTHPVWPLAASLFPLALAGYFLTRRVFNREVPGEIDRVNQV